MSCHAPHMCDLPGNRNVVVVPDIRGAPGSRAMHRGEIALKAQRVTPKFGPKTRRHESSGRQAKTRRHTDTKTRIFRSSGLQGVEVSRL